MPEERSAARRRNIARLLEPRHAAFIGTGGVALQERLVASAGEMAASPALSP